MDAEIAKRGTPKTLKQAIENGLDEPVFMDYRAPRSSEIEVVYAHVKDFLAQKFMAAMLDAHKFPYDDIAMKALFERVVK